MRTFLAVFIFVFLIACTPKDTQEASEESDTVAVQDAVDKEPYITHSVVFTLKHEVGSDSSTLFINDARRLLSTIPEVQNFEVRKEISEKNEYEFGFSMQFDDQDAYERYNNNPIHVDFVQNRWEKEVEKFLEIDYVLMWRE